MSETKKMANGENVIFYNNDLEQLLAQSAEECESLGILHLASYEKYNKLSNIINIPVIILSSGIGFITGIDLNYDRMNIILGIGSVFVGIIKSIDSYFQLGKRSESHRMCALQYTQINKKIQIELSLCREQRQTAKDMLSIIKTDIKNLQDISPVIDQEIIKEYNLKYGKYKNVKKPNFVNGLTVVKVNSNSLEQEMAAASLSHSVRSGGASRAMSVMGGDDRLPNQDSYFSNNNNSNSINNNNINNNNNNNNNTADFPVNIFNHHQHQHQQQEQNTNLSSNHHSPVITYMQTPNKQVGASAQLVYTPLSTLSNSIVQQKPGSKGKTPVTSSPVTLFKLQDPIHQNQNFAIATPPSQLSTPKLLSSFHNESQQNSILQDNGNNGNEMNLVIDIPEEINDNDGSPTNSQIGNM
jgi:hypothetical protein